MKKFQIILISVVLLVGVVTVVFLKTAYVVPVLMYHSIDDKDQLTKLSVNPKSFAAQMEFLHRNRYNVITLEHLAVCLKKGENVPPKTVVITFDDGYYNNYQYAYPLLKKYNFPATIFIIISKVGTPGYMGWREIKEMSDSGLITIGSHTISHKWLPAMGTKELRSELADSKRILEERTGRPVNTLCYPIGAHDDRVKTEAERSGYSCAVATNPGRYIPNDDVYAIKRIKISRTSDNLFVFWFETSGYYTWTKEWRGRHLMEME